MDMIAALRLEDADSLVWLPDRIGSFTSAGVWDSIPEKGQRVPRYKSVWFSGHIPRASFIGWLVRRINVLPTKDQLIPWFSLSSHSCEFGSLVQESRDHLCFTRLVRDVIWAVSV